MSDELKFSYHVENLDSPETIVWFGFARKKARLMWEQLKDLRLPVVCRYFDSGTSSVFIKVFENGEAFIWARGAAGVIGLVFQPVFSSGSLGLMRYVEKTDTVELLDEDTITGISIGHWAAAQKSSKFYISGPSYTVAITNGLRQAPRVYSGADKLIEFGTTPNGPVEIYGTSKTALTRLVTAAGETVFAVLHSAGHCLDAAAGKLYAAHFDVATLTGTLYTYTIGPGGVVSVTTEPSLGYQITTTTGSGPVITNTFDSDSGLFVVEGGVRYSARTVTHQEASGTGEGYATIGPLTTDISIARSHDSAIYLNGALIKSASWSSSARRIQSELNPSANFFSATASGSFVAVLDAIPNKGVMLYQEGTDTVGVGGAFQRHTDVWLYYGGRHELVGSFSSSGTSIVSVVTPSTNAEIHNMSLRDPYGGFQSQFETFSLAGIVFNSAKDYLYSMTLDGVTFSNKSSVAGFVEKVEAAAKAKFIQQFPLSPLPSWVRLATFSGSAPNNLRFG